MKRKLLAIGAFLSFGGLAYAGFTPIQLAPSSFNQDPVIEKTAPRSINDYVTVTPDQGTNKNGNTWYEVGYMTNTTGLPAHGSLVTAGTHTFQMAPDYHTNNVIFVGHNNGGWTPIMGPGSFRLATPTPLSYLSFLSGSGNGPVRIRYVVHYGDGSSEEGNFTSTDWFSSSTANRVFDAAGLLGMNGGVNNQSANHGAGYYADVLLANAVQPVTSVDFYYNGAPNNSFSPYYSGRTCIFAMSGSMDGTTFTPITVTGYNQDAVVEADAPHTFGSGPTSVTGTLTNGSTYCSFSMDGGIWKRDYTTYERGYYAAYPESGLPVAGSTITSATRPDIQYTVPASYQGNCAVCLSSNITSATVTFANPTSAGSLAFLGHGGNQGTPLNIRVEVQFQGAESETNWVTMVDWFNRTDPYAYVCFGQVRASHLAVRNTPDQFTDAFAGAAAEGVPFIRDPRLNGSFGSGNPSLPNIRLFDMICPISNSGAPISGVNLVITNGGTFNHTVAIFAVSGSPGTPPVITQPAGLVTDSASGLTNSTTGGAVANDIRLTKGRQGLDNITLWVSNQLGTAVSYQWKKAPRGGGFRDIYNKFDLTTFANVAGPNISGATDATLTISNATLADSADYVVVASNPYGSYTSFVATVMVLTTNMPILVGQGLGDTITKWSTDISSGGGQETYVQAIDQAAQKWLSRGIGGTTLVGEPIPMNTLPFAGPVGFTVIPVNGASVVNAIRFYCANDSPGRDPRDYLLEGSNDGASWAAITGGQLLGTLMLPTARGVTGVTPLNPVAQPLTEVNFANATAYKQYRFTITNNFAPANETSMQIAEISLLGTLVPNPPVWVRQPVPNVTVYAGASPTWEVLAGGYPPPRFIWFTNGVQVAGLTNSSFTLPNVQISQSGTTVSCRAFNSGGSLDSSSSTLTVIPAPTQSYATAVLASSPMAYVRLDEGPDNTMGNSGTVAKDYAGGHNGFYTNVYLAFPGYNPSSDPDTAVQVGVFTSADSAVMGINGVDFARSTNTAGATFSVEAWVYGQNQSANAAIVTKGYNGGLNVGTGTGTEQFALDVTGGAPSKFRFLVRNFFGQGYQALSAVAPADPLSSQAAWHHVVGVCDQPNGQIYLYVDGVLAASGTIPSNIGIMSQPMPMTIGARQSSGSSGLDQQWVGTIDEVAVYPSVLTPSQVLSHFYAAQRPPILTLHPASITTADNVPVTFTSSAYGPGTVGYQWYLSDSTSPMTLLAGQNASNLTFTTTPAQSYSYYQVVATNNYGAVTSAVAQLIVVSGVPSFIQDLPTASFVGLGHVIQLHVVAGGTAPFTYQWQKNGVKLNDDYRTSGTSTDTLIIGYGAATDSGNYSVVVTGAQGTTPSTTCALTVGPTTGFFGAGSGSTGWNLQGGATINNTTVSLSVGAGNTTRSAWLATKQDITAFSASFIYQDVSGSGGADGATFCIQNQSATALGGGGGAIGYAGITPSVALAFNIYGANGRGVGLLQNGTGNGNGAYASLLPAVGIGDNSNPVRVDLSYSGTTLTAKFTDTVTGGTVTTNWTVNIPQVVGASTAWVGFTGADGGTSSTQTMAWGAGTQPFAFKAQRVGANLVLSWPASAGAYLLSSPVLGPTATWTQATDPFQVIGTDAQVTVTPATGARFFRLQLFP